MIIGLLMIFLLAGVMFWNPDNIDPTIMPTAKPIVMPPAKPIVMPTFMPTIMPTTKPK